MSLQTSSSQQRASAEPAVSPPQRGRSAGPTITFSMVVGAVTALVLAMVEKPGAHSINAENDCERGAAIPAV